MLWLDPGEPAVREYSLRVVMDVVRRYDVDGVHFDDYFYPYPEKDAAGTRHGFSRRRKLAKIRGVQRTRPATTGGAPTWICSFRNVYHAIKAAKPWVKFGISPFGIWRPDHPPASAASTPTRNFMPTRANGCAKAGCDYFAPQLYWGIEPPQQVFPPCSTGGRSKTSATATSGPV